MVCEAGERAVETRSRPRKHSRRHHIGTFKEEKKATPFIARNLSIVGGGIHEMELRIVK